MFQNSWISYIIEYRLILGCTTYIFIFAFAIFRLKHTGHIMAPHPTQVLLNLLQRQVTFVHGEQYSFMSGMAAELWYHILVYRD